MTGKCAWGSAGGAALAGQGGPGGSDALQGPGGKKGGKILSGEPPSSCTLHSKLNKAEKKIHCGLLVRSQGEGTTLISLLPGKKNKLEK